MAKFAGQRVAPYPGTPYPGQRKGDSMVICPNCQTENRSGAKFCRNCASRLPESTAATRPLPESSLARGAATLRLEQIAEVTTATQNTSPAPASRSRTDTKPLSIGSNMTRRPAGAIFGDAFVYKSLIFSNEHQNHYLVTQVEVPENMRTMGCPKPECGAFFPPRQDSVEKFCTDCGSVLEANQQDLLLIETDSPFPENLVQIVSKGLSHGSVRAPLFTFSESLAGGTRYCLVSPQYSVLQGRPETSQALHWGASLGRGLDYLHDNGVWFNGRLDNECYSLAGDKAVWANLTGGMVHPDGYVTERSADIRALAGSVFTWLTGKAVGNDAQMANDPSLVPALQQVFGRAFSGAGFASGSEMAEAFELVLQELSTPQTVDFHMGRRTNVGMVRNLNEDSLFTMEVNRVQQSVSQPLGVYVVADGMGGHAAGEIASGAIVNTIAEKTLADLMPGQLGNGPNQDRREWLRGAVEAANRKVYDLRKTAGTDMGSTLVSAVVDGNKAYVAHVGDSRAYLINEQGIRQITTDHSLVERLIATNQITREEARHHPQRNVIYRTIGDKLKLDVDLSVHNLKPGDALLLCSDGLSGMVEDAQIYQIVRSAASPQAACDALIDAANAAGGEDNVSAVIVTIVPA